VGFLGGVTLVEEMVGERGVGGAEFGGEGLGFGGLGAGGAVGVERVADEEDLYAVLADEAGDGFEVGAEVGAVDGEERLRGEAEGVGEGEADAAVADVESQDARGLWSGGFHEISVRKWWGLRCGRCVYRCSASCGVPTQAGEC